LVFGTLLTIAGAVADPVPNLHIVVERRASLIGKRHIDKAAANQPDSEGKKPYKRQQEKEEPQHEDLHTIIMKQGSLITGNSEREQEELIENLINGKAEHHLISPALVKTFKDTLLDFEREFDSSYEILLHRKENIRLYQEKNKKLIDYTAIYKFYDSDTDLGTKFIVHIYPTDMPGTYAKSYGSTIFLRFNYGNLTRDLCAVLREVCSWLYDSITPNRAQYIEKYFMSHGSRCAKVAYMMFRDVLAHAIGNIWTCEQLKNAGQADSQASPHQNESIERIAQELVPIIKRYLVNRNEMDGDFFDRYIDLVERLYPQAKETPEILLTHVSLIVESGIDVTYCNQQVRAGLHTRRITNKVSDYSTIFVGLGLGHPALRSITEKIPNRDNDYLFVTTNSKGQLYIVIKTQDEGKIKKAIDKIKKMPKIQIGYIADLC
jgi:hypothetical protein